MSARWRAQINSQHLWLPLTSTSAVPIKGPSATQNSPFLPHQWPKPLPVLTAPTHGGMARLSWPEWPAKYHTVDPPKVVTNSSINRAWRSSSVLTWPTPLPLRQISHRFCAQGLDNSYLPPKRLVSTPNLYVNLRLAQSTQKLVAKGSQSHKNHTL